MPKPTCLPSCLVFMKQPDRTSDIFFNPKEVRVLYVIQETYRKQHLKGIPSEKKPFPDFAIPIELILLPELALREKTGLFT